jgi:hypothetical protein
MAFLILFWRQIQWVRFSFGGKMWENKGINGKEMTDEKESSETENRVHGGSRGTIR